MRFIAVRFASQFVSRITKNRAAAPFFAIGTLAA